MRLVNMLAAAALLAACGGPAGENAPAPAAKGGMKVTSPAFAEGQDIPEKYAGDGEDASPPLQWDGVPEGTASFALICADPDAKAVAGRVWYHWVIFDIPGTVTGLEEDYSRKLGVVEAPVQGKGSSGFNGYRGPSPPPGPKHRYYFRLYALDASPGLGAEAGADELMQAVKGHVLAEAELMGMYGR